MLPVLSAVMNITMADNEIMIVDERTLRDKIYVIRGQQVIRVAFMHKYPRAKLSDLVSLLSGRDFETREYKEEVVADLRAK